MRKSVVPALAFLSALSVKHNAHAETQWIYGPFVIGSGVADVDSGAFESDTLPNLQPLGDPTTGSFARTTSPVYRGSGALAGTVAKNFRGAGFGVSRSEAVVPGQTYILSGFIYRAGGLGANMYITASIPNADGAERLSYGAYSCGGVTNQWQFVYRPFEVPAGVTTVEVGMIHDAPFPIAAGDQSFFDDVAVTPASEFVIPSADRLFVDRQSTADPTPTITGRLAFGPHTRSQVTSITATIGSSTYQAALDPGLDTFSATVTTPLSAGIYDVIVKVNFSDGTTRTNTGCGMVNNELAIESIPGVFVTPSDGNIEVDYRFDGGLWQGQLGAFSMQGLTVDAYDLASNAGQTAFVKEAIRRVLSNSELGTIIVDDRVSRARFDGPLPGSDPANHNAGAAYAPGSDPAAGKLVSLTPNASYALILIPNGTFEQAAGELDKTDPDEQSQIYPIVSLGLPSDRGVLYAGQSAVLDVNDPNATVVGFEDWRGGDRDYNDIIVSLKNASLTMPPYTKYAADTAWTTSELGKRVLGGL